MKKLLFILLTVCVSGQIFAQRTETLLERNWRFNGKTIVSIPHDWAVSGPFSRDYDLQNVRVVQNNEKKASVKTGRTGGLPYVGKGESTRTFNVDGFDRSAKSVTLLFDGAMSEAHVSVNGKEAIFWPYGYNSFYCDVTQLLNTDGKNNLLDVQLENRPESSRWYPGAGLYRNVHLIVTDKTHIPVWGTYVTTPHVEAAFASVSLQTTVENVVKGKKLKLETRIYDAAGKEVASKTTTECNPDGQPDTQNFIVDNP